MKIETPYGPIRYGGPCRDDYRNIVLFHAGGGLVVKLQQPAMDSYREASKVLGRPIALTGSWRSCAYQTELHASDPARYADPDTSGHPRGLAIDVSQDQRTSTLAAIHRVLTARDWRQARSDEPWHYSMGVTI